MDRRHFLAAMAATFAHTRVTGAMPGTGAPGTGTPAGMPARPLERLGVQLFSLPKLLERDFAGTLQMLSSIGYREVELYGPYPFSLPEVQQRWLAGAGDLGFSGSGYFGHRAEKVRAMLDAAKLTAPSMHVDFDTLRTRTEQVGDAAQVLGHGYVGISSIPAANRRTLDDYRRTADTLNEVGARAARFGAKVLYHNHGYGLAPLDGQIPLRVLIERLDPTVVALEMDVFWTVAGGADPVELLQQYPRHYRLLHLKDASRQVRFSGDGGDRQQWIPLFPHMTTAGAGVLQLDRIVATAQRTGVEHFLVEQDNAADPQAALTASYRYLHALP